MVTQLGKLLDPLALVRLKVHRFPLDFSTGKERREGRIAGAKNLGRSDQAQAQQGPGQNMHESLLKKHTPPRD